jgi:hypothetical protein
MPQVRLTAGYFRTARRLAPTGTSTAQKLATCLKSLEEEPVPAPDDIEDFLPPVRPCRARRVAGTALLLMFDRRDDEVLVLAVRVG